MSHQSRVYRAKAGRGMGRSLAMIAIAAAVIMVVGVGAAAAAPMEGRVFLPDAVHVHLPGDLPGRCDHPGQHRHPAGYELCQDLEAAERRQLRLGAGHHGGLDDVRRRHDDGQRGACAAHLPGVAGAIRQPLRNLDRADSGGHVSERLEATPDERRTLWGRRVECTVLRTDQGHRDQQRRTHHLLRPEPRCGTGRAASPSRTGRSSSCARWRVR